jgi:hypothetical protein
VISQERYNRLDLELREAQAEIRRLTQSLELARSVATHACQVCAICQGEIVDVPVIGEAT